MDSIQAFRSSELVPEFVPDLYPLYPPFEKKGVHVLWVLNSCSGM